LTYKKIQHAKIYKKSGTNGNFVKKIKIGLIIKNVFTFGTFLRLLESEVLYIKKTSIFVELLNKIKSL